MSQSPIISTLVVFLLNEDSRKRYKMYVTREFESVYAFQDSKDLAQYVSIPLHVDMDIAFSLTKDLIDAFFRNAKLPYKTERIRAVGNFIKTHNITIPLLHPRDRVGDYSDALQIAFDSRELIPLK